MPLEWRDRVTQIENLAIDYHPGRRSQTQDLGSDFVYYDPWRRVKVRKRIAFEHAEAVHLVPNDLPSGWDHNEAGPRDPRYASRDFDPNDLTLHREDRMNPAAMLEVEQHGPIEGPSSTAAPANVSMPVETYPPQLAPDPYARQQVSRSDLLNRAPVTDLYAE